MAHLLSKTKTPYKWYEKGKRKMRRKALGRVVTTEGKERRKDK